MAPFKINIKVLCNKIPQHFFFNINSITIILSAWLFIYFLLSKLQQQKKYESKKTKCDHLLQYHSLSSMYLF